MIEFFFFFWYFICCLDFGIALSLLLKLENMVDRYGFSIFTNLAGLNDTLSMQLIDQMHELLRFVLLLQSQQNFQKFPVTFSSFSHLFFGHSLEWILPWRLIAPGDRVDAILQLFVLVSVAVLAVARILLLVLAVPSAQ
jgi:hypothetical protein